MPRRRTRGWAGVPKGGPLERDLNALGQKRKKKKKQEQKVREGLKEAFPEDRRTSGQRNTPRTKTQLQLKISDLRTKAGEARRSGNKKAASAYETVAKEYKRRLAKLMSEK